MIKSKRMLQGQLCTSHAIIASLHHLFHSTLVVLATRISVTVYSAVRTQPIHLLVLTKKENIGRRSQFFRCVTP